MSSTMRCLALLVVVVVVVVSVVTLVLLRPHLPLAGAVNIVLNPGCESSTGSVPDNWQTETGNTWECCCTGRNGVRFDPQGQSDGAVSISQERTLTPPAPRARAVYNVSAWQGRWSSGNDQGRAVFAFLDESRNVIAGYDPGWGARSRWTWTGATRVVDSSVRTVRIELFCTKPFGTTCDGYFDDISVVWWYDIPPTVGSPPSATATLFQPTATATLFQPTATATLFQPTATATVFQPTATATEPLVPSSTIPPPISSAPNLASTLSGVVDISKASAGTVTAVSVTRETTQPSRSRPSRPAGEPSSSPSSAPGLWWLWIMLVLCVLIVVAVCVAGGIVALKAARHRSDSESDGAGGGVSTCVPLPEIVEFEPFDDAGAAASAAAAPVEFGSLSAAMDPDDLPDDFYGSLKEAMDLTE